MKAAARRRMGDARRGWRAPPQDQALRAAPNLPMRAEASSGAVLSADEQNRLISRRPAGPRSITTSPMVCSCRLAQSKRGIGDRSSPRCRARASCGENPGRDHPIAEFQRASFVVTEIDEIHHRVIGARCRALLRPDARQIKRITAAIARQHQVIARCRSPIRWWGSK